MSRFTFFTTNRVKLAHFKYIGADFDVEVSGFRERTFYASYHEPKIRDREVLLRESYLSALEQWKKNGQSLDEIFFLEDTSVKVEALSSREETPGVDVKYWMRGMTFKKLDRLLARNGGSRRVTVRSDIIAHIPNYVRTFYKLTSPYLWVYAEQEGVVTPSEIPLKTNLVFPWLDEKTFNRWFVPDGAGVPISALPISEANQFDFRRAAFDRLLFEFSRLGLNFRRAASSVAQLPLPSVDPPTLYVVCGYSCAGKSTLADWLVRKYGFLHLEASDFMYQEFWQRHGVESGLRIGDFAEAALSQQPGIVASAIARLVRSGVLAPVVVTGFRSEQEISSLQADLPGYRVVPVFVDADSEVRYERAVSRNRESMTREKFQHRDAQERRMGVEGIASVCRNSTLLNNGSFDEFYSSFIGISEVFGFLLTESNLLGKPISLGSLEEAVIRTLGRKDDRCFGRDASGWYTTTEVAHLISDEFGVEKSKNNVSRYFNQGFHPFFELSSVKGKLRCRLSNTGVGVALLLGDRGLSGRKAPVSRRGGTGGRSGDLFSDSSLLGG